MRMMGLDKIAVTPVVALLMTGPLSTPPTTRTVLYGMAIFQICVAILGKAVITMVTKQNVKTKEEKNAVFTVVYVQINVLIGRLATAFVKKSVQKMINFAQCILVPCRF